VRDAESHPPGAAANQQMNKTHQPRRKTTAERTTTRASTRAVSPREQRDRAIQRASTPHRELAEQRQQRQRVLAELGQRRRAARLVLEQLGPPRTEPCAPTRLRARGTSGGTLAPPCGRPEESSELRSAPKHHTNPQLLSPPPRRAEGSPLRRARRTERAWPTQEGSRGGGCLSFACRPVVTTSNCQARLVTRPHSSARMSPAASSGAASRPSPARSRSTCAGPVTCAVFECLPFERYHR